MLKPLIKAVIELRTVFPAKQNQSISQSAIKYLHQNSGRKLNQMAKAIQKIAPQFPQKRQQTETEAVKQNTMMSTKSGWWISKQY